MFPCRTLPLGIRNVVDKLFIVKSPRSLRCSLNIFPMIYPIHIGPLFHQEFHKGWAQLILLAHDHGPMKPVRPHFLFLSSSGLLCSTTSRDERVPMNVVVNEINAIRDMFLKYKMRKQKKKELGKLTHFIWTCRLVTSL